ncbi:MAG: SDR family oxidoreductase [Planctomycetota bacterium]
MNKQRPTDDQPHYAIVTGGGSGIGRALCRRLAQLGWAVTVADIDRTAAEETVTQLPGSQCAHRAATIDVSSADAWHGLINDCRGAWPRLDLLVNNAGVLVGGEVVGTPPAALRRQVEVNLLGTMLGSQAAAEWLIASASRSRPADGNSPRSGVVNIASIFAALAPPGFAAYSASKAGVVAFSESLRGELATHGLNVTVALPGAVGTRLFERAELTNEAIRPAAERFFQHAELTPETTAAAILTAAGRGRRHTVIGRRASWYARLKRWLPDHTTHRVAERVRRELGEANG